MAKTQAAKQTTKDNFVEVNLAGIDLKKYPNKPLISHYLGRIEKEGRFGPEINHHFKKEDGTIIKVYGFTNLNLKLADVGLGYLVKVVYTGMTNVKTKYGMKEVHQCTVGVDYSKRISDVPEFVKTTHADVPETPDNEPEAEGEDLPF